MGFRRWVAEQLDADLKYERLADSFPQTERQEQPKASPPAPSFPGGVGRREFNEKSYSPSQLADAQLIGKAMATEWDTDKAIEEGFKATTWVYICVHKIATSAASAGWVVEKRVGGGSDQWEVASDHPLQALLDRPNEKWALSELLYRICAGLYLGGNAIISKVRGLGTVAELWTLGPNGIQPIPNREEFISGYLYTLGGKEKTLPASDIIHLQFPDPATPYWGTSPLMAAARAVDTEQSAMTFQQVGLQNRAVTDGVLSYKMDLTKKQYEKYREQINEQMMGPSNARKMIITGHDADYKQLSLSPAEMDFIESRRFGREEICAAHQVPPPVVGIYENATLANIETARKIFWLDTVIPLLGQIRDALNISLTPEFGEDIRINYDVSKVEALWPVFKERIEAARKLWEMGVPFNELNRRFELGFNDTQSGDMGFIPSTMVPADMFQADTLTDEE